ncbi:MAG: acetate--CoA ligase family protein [Thermoplasmata archaeon]|nr:acetate--CoA ligase family protein [Thermoplasmata archaeon]
MAGIEASEVFGKVLAEGRTVLSLDEARSVLESIGIKFNAYGFAGNLEEAIQLSRKIGYPVAMKIVSPDIIHKTEVGGVKLYLQSELDIVHAYEQMMENVRKLMPNARVLGVSVEEMLRGTELVIGVTRDEQFGPMLMFGLGGIWVEIYKDVSFRIIPLERVDAWEMIHEIKGIEIIEGARGFEPVNKKKVVDYIMKVSSFVEKHQEIEEMDINPLMGIRGDLYAIDARIILRGREEQK